MLTLTHLFGFSKFEARFEVCLIEISVKAMDKENEGFAYLRQTFPTINEVKMKGEIFVGLQITQLFDDQDFRTKVNYTERRALTA